MQRTKVLTAVLACLLVPSFALVFGDLTFTPEGTLSVPVNPAGLDYGDFNGDGELDLAVAADTLDRVDVFLNSGGTFGAATPVLTGAGTSPEAVVARDLDGDGDIDLAVTLKNIHTVQILLNMGGANFVLGSATLVGLEPRDLVAGDFDGDNDLDLATANRDDGTVTILINSGAAVFTLLTPIFMGDEPRELATGDFENDGDLDLAVTNHDTREVFILSNDGSGVFAVSTTLPVGAEVRPDGIETGDLDLDGDIDLAVTTASNGGGFAFNFLAVFLNNAGVFTGPTNTTTGGIDPAQLILGDLDGDGDLDVATTQQTSNDIALLENDGSAVFTLAAPLAAGTSPENIVAFDFDGNGSLDLACSNRDSDNVSLFSNDNVVVGDEFIRGDADGDGIFNGLSDALYILTHQFLGGPPPPCMESADADGDSIFNGLSDGLYVLTHQFLGGPPPGAPYPTCGVDPAPGSTLGCIGPVLCL